MSTLQYIYDTKETYDTCILDGLKAYNTSQTGERLRKRQMIYVFDQDQLVGGVNATLGWDWIHLNHLFYDDTQSLHVLLNETYKALGPHAEGVMIDTFYKPLQDALLDVGFSIDATIDDVPKGHTFFTLVNRQLTPISTLERFDVITSEDVIETYKTEYRAKYDEFIAQYGDERNHPTYTIACLDQGTCIGGVVASEQYDNVYIDLLYVDQKYRGQQIGTMLMQKAEEEAIKRGAIQLYLGTCSFQAPGFYETLGYTKVGETKNFPKGFTNYTFIKKLK